VLNKYSQALKVEGKSPEYVEHRDLTIRLFAKFVKKDMIEVTTEDILAFLSQYRKSEEVDLLHKGIGTYNQRLSHLIKYFKWLYHPDISPRERPRPSIVQNLKPIKRKEKSIYKPTDLWTVEDDLLFLKYCPLKRDRCYHAMSRDASCRPSEILKLRIKDVVFKMAGNKQYAEILVNGKTGSRHIPLINSIPYVKDHLDEHPFRTVPNSPLICGFGKSLGKFMKEAHLWRIYKKYKTEYFPRLLNHQNIPSEDKQKITELLTKPWNPYIRRHSALTEKSKFLKESILRQHAGWTNDSQMPNIYLHYFGNESSESILEAYGLKTKQEEIDKMHPVQCPNCSEPNKLDSKFCAKCRMVLSYDAYTETVEEKESEIKLLGQKYERDMKDMREEMESKFSQILEKIDVKKLS
jgi:integrase/recombinase XerD